MKADKNPWMIIPAFLLGMLLAGNSIAAYFNFTPAQELARTCRSRVLRGRRSTNEFNLTPFLKP
jgi:hypothetical protein